MAILGGFPPNGTASLVTWLENTSRSASRTRDGVTPLPSFGLANAPCPRCPPFLYVIGVPYNADPLLPPAAVAFINSLQTTRSRSQIFSSGRGNGGAFRKFWRRSCKSLWALAALALKEAKAGLLPQGG